MIGDVKSVWTIRGQCIGRSDWDVAAYVDKEQAIAHLDRLSNCLMRAQEFGYVLSDDVLRDTGLGEMDRHLPLKLEIWQIRERVYYFLQEVALYRHLDEFLESE
jgi:hypothetical protein